MPTIQIDNKEYDTDDLSEEALSEINSLQFVDQEILRLQAKTAAMQTARNAYAKSLESLLPSRDE